MPQRTDRKHLRWTGAKADLKGTGLSRPAFTSCLQESAKLASPVHHCTIRAAIGRQWRMRQRRATASSGVFRCKGPVPCIKQIGERHARDRAARHFRIRPKHRLEKASKPARVGCIQLPAALGEAACLVCLDHLKGARV